MWNVWADKLPNDLANSMLPICISITRREAMTLRQTDQAFCLEAQIMLQNIMPVTACHPTYTHFTPSSARRQPAFGAMAACRAAASLSTRRCRSTSKNCRAWCHRATPVKEDRRMVHSCPRVQSEECDQNCGHPNCRVGWWTRNRVYMHVFKKNINISVYLHKYIQTHIYVNIHIPKKQYIHTHTFKLPFSKASGGEFYQGPFCSIVSFPLHVKTRIMEAHLQV